MATKKVYKKDNLVTSIDELVRNKHKPFIITRYDKIMNVDYKHLSIISLSGIIKLIDESRLYYAIIVEEEIVRKSKPKVIPKAKSNISGCKATLDDIYNES